MYVTYTILSRQHVNPSWTTRHWLSSPARRARMRGAQHNLPAAQVSKKGWTRTWPASRPGHMSELTHSAQRRPCHSA